MAKNNKRLTIYSTFNAVQKSNAIKVELTRYLSSNSIGQILISKDDDSSITIGDFHTEPFDFPNHHQELIAIQTCILHKVFYICKTRKNEFW